LTPCALDVLRRGLVIAQDGGNRAEASAAAEFLARREAEHGDTVSAFDHLTLAIRNYHNCGNTTSLRGSLAFLAALFDRLERYEPAATIAGFALSPIAAARSPKSPPRLPTSAMSSATRPTNHSPARVRR
jgi:hypothetical protein